MISLWRCSKFFNIHLLKTVNINFQVDTYIQDDQLTEIFKNYFEFFKSVQGARVGRCIFKFIYSK